MLINIHASSLPLRQFNNKTSNDYYTYAHNAHTTYARKAQLFNGVTTIHSPFVLVQCIYMWIKPKHNNDAKCLTTKKQIALFNTHQFIKRGKTISAVQSNKGLSSNFNGIKLECTVKQQMEEKKTTHAISKFIKANMFIHDWIPHIHIYIKTSIHTELYTHVHISIYGPFTNCRRLSRRILDQSSHSLPHTHNAFEAS